MEIVEGYEEYLVKSSFKEIFLLKDSVKEEQEENNVRSSKNTTACVNPIDFFFWPAKCIKTKKFDIKLDLFYSSVTTISLSGTNLNRNAFFDLLFESWS